METESSAKRPKLQHLKSNIVDTMDGNLRSKLRPHQLEATTFILNRTCDPLSNAADIDMGSFMGVVLADEMGTGKVSHYSRKLSQVKI